MAARKDNPQFVISQMMMEDMGMGPTSGSVKGGGPTDSTMGSPYEETQVSFMEVTPGDNELENDGEEGFTEREMKLTKRFIELIGGADRAREIIDKVDECEDCLDIIDDDENDTNEIEKMAGMIPQFPDLPTSIKNNLNMASLYNPNAVSGMM